MGRRSRWVPAQQEGSRQGGEPQRRHRVDLSQRFATHGAETGTRPR